MLRLNTQLTALLSALLSYLPVSTFAEMSGTWEQELVYSTGENSWQKVESLIEPEWNTFLGEVEVTAISRVRLDFEGNLGPSVQKPENFSRSNGPLYSSDKIDLSIRELFLDAEWAGSFLRIGKQQVVWGQADGLKVLDKINPQSFREFILDDFDDSRIPLWMLNVEVPIDEDMLQLLWIPDASTHELPEQGAPFEFTRSALIPKPPLDANGVPLLPVAIKEADTPGRFFHDSDIGLRYSRFTDSGWDITLNYLYHYLDLPVLYQDVVNAGSLIEITPTYKRSHLIGTTLSNAIGDFTLRTELGYDTDTYHLSKNQRKRGVENSPEFGSVIGLDYQGLSDTFLSIQWFQSYLTHYHSSIIRDQSSNRFTVLMQRDFSNETWRVETLMIHNLNDEDGLVRPKLSHQFSSDLELWGGADIFYGDKDGLYGEFDRRDRLVAGFEWGF